MVNSVGNAGPSPNNMSGIGIYCNVIDPSKLPPDHPILQGNMPNCTVVGPGMGGGCYPPGYYLNNYGNTVKKRVTVLTDNYIQQLDKYLDNDNRDLRQIIKGHFQTSFIVNLLKQLTSRIKGNGSPSISKDTLYALLITCYPECHVDCNEKKVIIKRVNDAIEALK